MVTTGIPAAGGRGGGFEVADIQALATLMTYSGLTVLRLPPGCPALWCKAGDHVLDSMATWVVSGREGAPRVTQETLLLILDWVEVRVNTSATANPTLAQLLLWSPAAPADD